MDGRGRLAEPVTDAALPRTAAGAALAFRRLRAPTRPSASRNWLIRKLRRGFAPIESCKIPSGAGAAAVSAFLLASIAFGVVRGGHLPTITTELRDLRDTAANLLGFRIGSIALSGNHRLTREDILTAAGITGRSSLLFLDAAEARARLKANPWIAEATVLKLYPGRLQIAVKERKAFALWQKDGKVSVIAEDGTIVEPSVSKAFASLPLVVGTGAETRAKKFLALLDNYPPIRSRLHAAVLVAERRWNLVLNNGIDVKLPENEVDRALAVLLALEREKRLFSRDITAIDLRLSDRVTVRLSDEAAAARQEALQDKKNKKKGGAA